MNRETMQIMKLVQKMEKYHPLKVRVIRKNKVEKLNKNKKM